MDLKFKRLDEVATKQIRSVPAGATVSDALAASGDAHWVVLTGVDQRPVGLVPAADLHEADGTQKVSSLFSGPLVVQRGRSTVAEAVRDARFTAHEGMLTEIRGLVVVTDDGTEPIGVWSGPDFNQFLVAGVRGFIDTQLGGVVGIDNLVQRCRFAEDGKTCSSTQEFAEMPDEMPDCANPDKLTDHKFVWE
jgi:CBS domain-containing protein